MKDIPQAVSEPLHCQRCNRANDSIKVLLCCNYEICHACIEDLVEASRLDFFKPQCPRCWKTVTESTISTKFDGKVTCDRCEIMSGIADLKWCALCVSTYCNGCDVQHHSDSGMLGHLTVPWDTVTVATFCRNHMGNMKFAANLRSDLMVSEVNQFINSIAATIETHLRETTEDTKLFDQTHRALSKLYGKGQGDQRRGYVPNFSPELHANYVCTLEKLFELSGKRFKRSRDLLDLGHQHTLETPQFGLAPAEAANLLLGHYGGPPLLRSSSAPSGRALVNDLVQLRNPGENCLGDLLSVPCSTESACSSGDSVVSSQFSFNASSLESLATVSSLDVECLAQPTSAPTSPTSPAESKMRLGCILSLSNHPSATFVTRKPANLAHWCSFLTVFCPEELHFVGSGDAKISAEENACSEAMKFFEMKSSSSLGGGNAKQRDVRLVSR